MAQHFLLSIYSVALWKPDKEDAAVFYVTAVGWGLCNAIWETLLLSKHCLQMFC